MILIYERFKVYSHSQCSGKSVADFVAALKSLAHTCSFGDTLSDMLCDRFVMGLANETTQHTLSAEAKLTFTCAVELATAGEAAVRDVQAIEGAIHNTHLRPPRKNKSFNTKSKPKLLDSKTAITSET